MVRLNMGCGAVRPEGWVNIDSSLNAHLQKIPLLRSITRKLFGTVQYDNHNVVYMNLNKRWSAYKDNSVDVVYASHFFEHLSLSSADLFLKESFRCLKPGGVIRLVVPDIYKLAKNYIEEYESGVDNPAEFFMWAFNMHREGQYGSSINFFKKQVYEQQGYPHQHKYMYDEKSLGKKMAEAGFTDILSLEYGISNYLPEIKDVEGKAEAHRSVYMEAKKPA
jgi:predicted SAM-dependent methyltransferase